MNIYEKAKYGCNYVFNCTNISAIKHEEIFSKVKRADKRKVTKIAIQLGIIDKAFAKLWNPYNCHKTDEYLIYTHSAIDFFIKVN